MLERLPVGLRSRARATGRIALGVGRRGLGRLFGAGGAQADAELGAAVLAELDQLKGMAMKVGQILSYMDVGFPEEVTEALAKLQVGVTPMPRATIVAEIERSLGRPLDACFSTFEDPPIAAASIGQVHRARTLEGQAVAVKVRYPDVAETLEGDFAQLGRLGALAGAFTAVDGRALVEELHARVLEECDYRREAAWQACFREHFRGHPDLEVPEVHEALCSESVLTTTFADAATFEAFRSRAGSPERDRAGAALLMLAFSPLLTQGWLHADPHPGNVLYQCDGRIVALDFGCVRAFEPAFVARLAAFSRAVLDGDRGHFRALAVQLGLAPRPERLDFEELFAFYAWLYAPVAKPGFDFADAWWAEGQRFSRPSAKNARHQGFPPEWIWLQRVQWGLWAVLRRLGVRADLARPFRALLEEAPHA